MRQQVGLLFRGCSCSSVTAVHDDAVVSRRATSVVPVVYRCKNCSNTPSPTGTQQQSSDELVQIEEEELLHEDSLSRECGEVCVSNEEGGGSVSSVCDAEDDV